MNYTAIDCKNHVFKLIYDQGLDVYSPESDPTLFVVTNSHHAVCMFSIKPVKRVSVWQIKKEVVDIMEEELKPYK